MPVAFPSKVYNSNSPFNSARRAGVANAGRLLSRLAEAKACWTSCCIVAPKTSTNTQHTFRCVLGEDTNTVELAPVRSVHAAAWRAALRAALHGSSRGGAFPGTGVHQSASARYYSTGRCPPIRRDECASALVLFSGVMSLALLFSHPGGFGDEVFLGRSGHTTIVRGKSSGYPRTARVGLETFG